MEKYKLDRTAFKIQTFEEAADTSEYWKNKTYAERLEAADYLNSVAFNYDINNPPRLDRSFFSMRKRD